MLTEKKSKINKNQYILDRISKTTVTAIEFTDTIELICNYEPLSCLHDSCLSIAREYSKITSLLMDIASGKVHKRDSVKDLLLESLYSYDESMRIIMVKVNRSFIEKNCSKESW